MVVVVGVVKLNVDSFSDELRDGVSVIVKFLSFSFDGNSVGFIVDNSAVVVVVVVDIDSDVAVAVVVVVPVSFNVCCCSTQLAHNDNRH